MTGHLGADAKVEEVNGRAVIKFSVAHSERYVDKSTGEQKERTFWVRCSQWKDLGDTKLAPYLLKGTHVLVEGRPTASGYLDQEKKPAASLDLAVERIEFLSPKPKEQAPAAVAQTAAEPAAEAQHA